MLYHDFHNKKNKIILLIHKNPDGDALGSSLALMLYLKKYKHFVDIISPTEYSKSFSWLPGIKNILVLSEKTRNLIRKKIIESDYIFCIDFNNLSRIGDELKEYLLLCSNSKNILLDHHPNPIHFFDIIFHDLKASATSVIVYRFISSMGDFNKIDKEMATCIYVGLMTDTGYFRFSSVNSETHFIAGKLIEKQVDVYYIYKNLHENYNENRLKLLSKALQNLKIIKKYHTVYTSIEEKDISYDPYKQGDTDGIITYGLNIKNIVLSVLFFQEKNKYPVKISFRSKGNFDVNILARKYFGGGGHKNASGCILLNKNINESVNYFLDIIPNYYENNFKNSI
ncbi:DHH family phosphoesterase [Blattabacterium cuenoti]|uniref:DHH family phosphoesterase n=1 Tax=Blattabacterium cuenoti TaxID=1653831 RepID=UPI00163B9753|nr:bifunctional oligoribonuclease/PAP phosphatase NrnA [Blattabacterium cuenoti]